MEDDRFNVRIGQFVPDAPPVDFIVDGYPVLSDRAFGDIPPYSEHRAAEYEVSVRDSETGETIHTASIEFVPGAFHTLLLVGTAAEPEFRLLTDGEYGATIDR